MQTIQTETLVIGASIAGLATAACLKKKNIPFILIEKQNQAATPWRNHYERLHLHTNKRISSLPYKKFAASLPRYPSRRQVVDYLDEYRKELNIEPVYNTEAIEIKKSDEYWTTQTTNGLFQSKYVVVATGFYCTAKEISFKGMDTFPGKILHSAQYKTGKDFKRQNVLVVGFGNSACEIAIDLFEQGASPSMAVRSPVNVIPRDMLGVPVLELSLLMKKLSPRIADIISAPLINLSIGNITKLGLRKSEYGPIEEIIRNGKVPILDIGTISHIRKGHIKVHGSIESIEGSTIHFIGGEQKNFDAIVAAIGYDRADTTILKVERERFDDLKFPVPKQKMFGIDGLYFCGFWISPTGHIHEISSDAKAIAKDIAKKVAS
ncbi:MAG: NAD(P)/FAD-dependent oxidoreductase [Chitinophagaceae bacterium]